MKKLILTLTFGLILFSSNGQNVTTYTSAKEAYDAKDYITLTEKYSWESFSNLVTAADIMPLYTQYIAKTNTGIINTRLIKLMTDEQKEIVFNEYISKQLTADAFDFLLQINQLSKDNFNANKIDLILETEANRTYLDTKKIFISTYLYNISEYLVTKLDVIKRICANKYVRSYNKNALIYSLDRKYMDKNNEFIIFAKENINSFEAEFIGVYFSKIHFSLDKKLNNETFATKFNADFDLFNKGIKSWEYDMVFNFLKEIYANDFVLFTSSKENLLGYIQNENVTEEQKLFIINKFDKFYNNELCNTAFDTFSWKTKVEIATKAKDVNKIIDTMSEVKNTLSAETLNEIIKLINVTDIDFRKAEINKILRNINAQYTLYLYDDKDTWEPIISKVRALIDIR